MLITTFNWRSNLLRPAPEERQARLETEHHNLRAAIEWSLKRGQVDIALRLGNALWRFWRAAHLSEGRRLLSDILANPAASDSAQLPAQLLGAAGKLALAQGDVTHAHIHLQDTLRIWRELRDEGGAAEVLSALSSLAFDTGKDEEAARYAQESLEKYERLSDESLRLHGMARAHGQLGGGGLHPGIYGRSHLGGGVLHKREGAFHREPDPLGEGIEQGRSCPFPSRSGLRRAG